MRDNPAQSLLPAAATLSEAEARALFDELRRDETFVWDYPDDCCLARAHRMCHIFHERGIGCEKIRADNPSGSWLGSFGLAIPRRDAPGEYMCVSFHIAPVIRVATERGIEERVIDPALFDGPVTLGDWSAGLVNRNALRPDHSIDPELTAKEYTRLPHDVFEIILFRERKDAHLEITNALLADHRREMAELKQRKAR